MARKPPNFQWFGYSDEQLRLLDRIDFYGNNIWARNSQTEAVMTGILDDCAAANLGIGEIVGAMRSIGYEADALHMLERWESKRTTGRFGK